MEIQEPVLSVGSRLFSPGDIIMSCSPLVWVLERAAYKTHCAYCFHDNQALRKCSGCQVHHYCNATCQVADWKMEHKLECAALREIIGRDEDVAPMTMVSGPLGRIKSNTFTMTKGAFTDMMCKLDFKLQRNVVIDIPGIGPKCARELLLMLPTNPAQREIESIMQLNSDTSIWPENMIPRKDTLLYYGIISYNAWPVYNAMTGSTKAPIGFALYPQASRRKMTPVCWDVNVVANCRSRQLVLHAVQDIPRFTGLQDFRYCELLEPSRQTRTERSDEFQKRYGYPCPCRSCTEEYDADINPLQCVTSGCTNRIPSDSRALTACSECGALNGERLAQFRGLVQKYEGLKWCCNRNPNTWIDCVTNLVQELDMAGILQTDAHFRFVCGWILPRKYFKENRLEDGWKMMEKLTISVRRMYPKYDLFRYLQLTDQATSSSIALHRRVMNWVDQLLEAELGLGGPRPGKIETEGQRPTKKELEALTAHISCPVLRYCQGAKEIVVVLFGDKSKEVQKADTVLEGVAALFGQIEQIFARVGQNKFEL
ncbi:uncharacterized protein LOC129592267 [Paramacrobiotus metropolitanus]|uniref:uncharacterized protein LOC129592267 n=1 Tax=Paramacrobiotus metropolitanus TaxID=2943436 RepID=UPI002446162D|nr:uncharacterized protein LOC129592267 [Paramacrobiotus metropolitanus]